MFKLDLRKFKKVSGDEHHTVMRHEAGHEIRLDHKALAPQLRKELDKLHMAEGGEAKPFHGYNPNKHSKSGGLNDKYREKYNREHGSHLQRPSKDKENPRHKSFCARMKGVKGPTSKEGKLTPKGAALKRWNCHAEGGEIEQYDEYDVPCTCGADHEAHGGEMRQSNPKLEESKKVPHYAGGGDVEDDEMEDMLSRNRSEMPEAASEEEQLMQEMPQEESPDMAAPTPTMSPALSSIDLSGEGGEALRQAAGVEAAPAMPGAPAAMPMAAKAGKPGEPVIPDKAKGQYELALDQVKFQQAQNKILEDENANKAAAIRDQIRIQEQANDKINDIQKRMTEQMGMLINEVKDKKIDPNRFWNSMDTGQKVLAGISLFLGGFAAGMKGTTNSALEFLNKEIDRDIDAQIKDRSDKMNLYKINLQLLGDEKAAAMASKMQQLNLSALRVAQKSAMATDQMTKMRGEQMSNALVQQAAQIKSSIAMKEYLKQEASKAGLINYPPEQIVGSLIPERLRDKAYKEVKTAQDNAHLARQALKTFDELTSQYSGMGRVGAAVYTPAQAKILEDIIAQTVGEKTGTVRYEAMKKAIDAYVPTFYDTDERKRAKRENFSIYLSSLSSSPVFDNYSPVPLRRFTSAATAESAEETRHPMGNIQPVTRMIGPKGDQRPALYDPITKKFIKVR